MNLIIEDGVYGEWTVISEHDDRVYVEDATEYGRPGHYVFRHDIAEVLS